MTSLLEQRYRTVLRMLPSSYRARREEEMVDTYLEDFDEEELDELRPSLGEVRSIAALAVRARMGSAGAPARYALAGSAVRLFALLSILLHGARELTDRAMSVALYNGATGEDRELMLSMFDGHEPLAAVNATCQLVLPLCWVAAYAALLRDRRRAALVLSVLAALPGGLWLLLDPVFGAGGIPSGFSVATTAFAWLTVLAVGCGFHSDAPAARMPLGAKAGLALMAVCVLMGLSIVVWATESRPDYTWSSGAAFTVAVLAWYAARARGVHGTQDPSQPLALAAVGLAVLAERAGMLALLVEGHLTGVVLNAAWAQGAVTVVLVAGLAASGTRAARRGTEQDPARGTDGAMG
jgi:hypothetical protein